jgi:hypothetical protein
MVQDGALEHGARLFRGTVVQKMVQDGALPFPAIFCESAK